MTREFGHSSSRDRLGLALQAAGLGEFEWDFARDVFVVSDRMAAITGIPAGERPALGGAALDEFVHPEDLDQFRERRVADSMSANSFTNVFRNIRPDDGRTIWVRVSGVIERQPYGQPTILMGIVQDVTHERREEDQRHH